MFLRRITLQVVLLCQVLARLSAISFDNRTMSYIASNGNNVDDLLGYMANKKKSSKQDNRFLKFDYLSQHIQIGFEFLVPVIQVPVTKANDLKDFPAFLSKGLPTLTINIGAVILALVVFIVALLAHLILNYKPLYLVHLFKTMFKSWRKVS